MRCSQVVDAFLPIAFGLLHPEGLFYLVLVAQNRPHDLIDHVRRAHGWLGEVRLPEGGPDVRAAGVGAPSEVYL